MLRSADLIDWIRTAQGVAATVIAIGDYNRLVELRPAAAVLGRTRRFTRGSSRAAEGWLIHYLNFSGERMLPSIPRSSTNRSGSTRATGTTWAPQCRPSRDAWRTIIPPPRAICARPDLQRARLGKRDPSHRDREHRPRAGGRRGDPPDQADPERVAGRPAAAPGSGREWENVMGTICFGRSGYRRIRPDLLRLTLWHVPGFEKA
jgi:hypothetical protein